MEGPRGVRADERDSLRKLTDIVFRPGMPEQYPQLFNDDNQENLRVCVDDGKVVSHVGMIERGALLFGCPVKVCCIGAVSTHPDYRKQGLASACFDDAAAKALRDGVDVMIVSGDRNLYRTRGCLHVGRDQAHQIHAGSIPPALTSLAESVTAAKMTEEELPLVKDCYRREPVRFLRPPEDYRYAVQSAWAMNSPSEFVVIRENGTFRGYALVRLPKQNRQGGLTEFAGDRHAVLAALPQLLRAYSLETLDFQVMGHDPLLSSLCAEVGLQGTPRTTAGTVKLIHFSQLMERMRPRFEELLGARATATLRFWQEDDQYGFALGEEKFVTDRDTATYAVFGTREGLPEAIQNVSGALGETLRAILPLPTLWYGINYV